MPPSTTVAATIVLSQPSSSISGHRHRVLTPLDSSYFVAPTPSQSPSPRRCSRRASCRRTRRHHMPLPRRPPQHHPAPPRDHAQLRRPLTRATRARHSITIATATSPYRRRPPPSRAISNRRFQLRAARRPPPPPSFRAAAPIRRHGVDLAPPPSLGGVPDRQLHAARVNHRHHLHSTPRYRSPDPAGRRIWTPPPL